MKFKNEIFLNGFVESFNNLFSRDLPIKESYKLKEFGLILADKEKIFQEQRNEIFNKNVKKEDGKPMMTEDKKGYVIETPTKFNEQMQELLSIEFDVATEQIKLPEDIKISAKELHILSDLISI